jgi:hypothetical protein
MSDTSTETSEPGPGREDLIIGPTPSGRRHPWLSISVALVVGLLLGRLSLGHTASHNATSAPTPQPRPTTSTDLPPGTVDILGCPLYRTCSSRKLHAAPTLIGVLRSNFPEAVVNRLTATDDSLTKDRYLVRLDATLSPGLDLDVIADNRASAPAAATPWIFVAVGEAQRPQYATKTIVTGAGNGPVLHITIASNDVVHPVQAATRCDSCEHTISRSAAAARLQGLSRTDHRGVLSAITAAVRAAGNSAVLTWFRQLTVERNQRRHP